MIDLAKLGCRIQHSVRHDNSENIRVPRHIAQIDEVIACLPAGQRAALTSFYIRSPNIPRRKVKSKALLLAEVRVMHSL